MATSTKKNAKTGKTSKTTASKTTVKKAATTKRATARKAAPKKTAEKGAYVPSEREVRERAFQLFMNRGGQPGNELNDWLRAEKELGANL